ncbi:MarR family winged helix-turn-helix transcriptional regulator [Brevundimonas sp. UBA5936]|uniref:MarR family winged helix-turn-helix transcriptional regulator n=1 Tax=Brevundimonas sp. UBA5936 TaxID=1946133 RepID=UPI0039C8B70B
MQPSVARGYFGSLVSAVADEMTATAGEASRMPGPATTVLSLLNVRSGQSIRRLSDGIGLSHAGTVRLIDRLEADGLVERRPELSDLRARFIHLTPVGRKVMADMAKARSRAVEAWLAPLSPEELSRLGATAQRLLEGRAVEVVDGHTRSVSRSRRKPSHRLSR